MGYQGDGATWRVTLRRDVSNSNRFTRDGALDDRYADEIIAAEQGDGPQPVLRFIVVTVVLLEEEAGLAERDWPDDQPAHG
jgi:hypothetical protein